tara:strand:- start:87 stop:224 length:138 start_codon:yes stop_codon:yes gene_type:complete
MIPLSYVFAAFTPRSLSISPFDLSDLPGIPAEDLPPLRESIVFVA